MIDAERTAPAGTDEQMRQVRGRLMVTVGMASRGSDSAAEPEGVAREPFPGAVPSSAAGIGTKILVVTLVGAGLAGTGWYAMSKGKDPTRSESAVAAPEVASAAPSPEDATASVDVPLHHEGELARNAPSNMGMPSTRHAEAPRRHPPATHREDQQGPAVVSEPEIIEGALAAFSNGDFPKALELAAAHERFYPGGALAEEREVLRIRCHVARRDAAAARGAAELFARRYPTSIHRRSVASLVESLEER